MSKITNDSLTTSETGYFSCTHIATVGVKGLTIDYLDIILILVLFVFIESIYLFLLSSYSVLLTTQTPYILVIVAIQTDPVTKNVLDTLRRLVSTAESGATLDVTLDDLETTDDRGNTVVHYAARFGFCQTLRRVLTSPRVVSVPNRSGVTPLHVAADRGFHDDVEVLILCLCPVPPISRNSKAVETSILVEA